MEHNLPECCYGVLISTHEVIIIKRGEIGYYPTHIVCKTNEDARSIADERNEILGITKAQAEAMLCGSMFGWNVPGADPNNYDADGRMI